jgi:hypothetical protein
VQQPGFATARFAQTAARMLIFQTAQKYTEAREGDLMALWGGFLE